MALKKNNPSQGDVWLFDPDPVRLKEIGEKVRPCLIISNNFLNSGSSELLMIIPISSTPKGVPSHIRIDPPEGNLNKVSFGICEQIRSISKERLIEKLGIIQSKTILIEIRDWIHDLIRLT